MTNPVTATAPRQGWVALAGAVRRARGRGCPTGGSGGRAHQGPHRRRHREHAI